MINSRLIKSSPEGMKYVYKSVAIMWISLVANIIATISIGFTIQKLYNSTLDRNFIILMVVLVLSSIIIRYVCNIQSTKFSYNASTYIKTSLREQFYQKLLRLGGKHNTAEITQIGSEGIEQIEIYFSLYLPQFFYSMLAPLTLFAVLSFFSIKISLILLICVPLIPMSIIAANKIAKRLLHKYWSIYTGLGDSFLDNLNGLTTLKIYQDDEHQNQKMNEEAEEFRKITMKVLTMQLNSVTLMDLIAYGGAALGIIFSLKEFSAGNISMAQTVIFILLSSEFFIPLRLLGSYFHIAMNGIAAIKKIYNIIDLPDKKEKTNCINSDKLDIEFKNLNFSYTSDRSILHDINFTIPDKSCIALVGESGCGKSTIASLLMGFNESSCIFVNGVPLDTINENDIMKHMTIVKHRNYIFMGSVRDNLLFGNPLATDGQCYESLAKVDLENFVRENGGLDFELLEKGSNLSGGQMQRLCLARSILYDAQLYIFDEATSNIDVESEEIIFKTISDLRKTKTVVLISHRLANITNADRIYMLEGGTIVESGTHAELLNNKNNYYNLFSQQQQLEKIRVQ